MNATENAGNWRLEAALAKKVGDRSLPERVLVAGSDQSSQPFVGEKYPEIVAERMQDADRTLHRRGVTLVLLMVLFVLFTNANITELELGGIKLTDATPIYRLLPLGIAIYYSELLALSVLMILQRRVLVESLKTRYPQLVENDLDFGFCPASRINMNSFLTAYIAKLGTTVDRVATAIFAISVAFFVVAPIAFLLYAFDSLKTQYGSHNWFFVVTLVLAVFFVVEGLVWFWVLMNTNAD